MEQQDFNNDFHLKLSAEFKRIDKFLAKFQRHFIREQWLIANEHPISDLSETELKEHIKEYANRMFSCANSVPDKDENYNEIRLVMELEAMTRLIKKYPATFRENKLALKTHQKAKEVLIYFFPVLTELSANGFRLLEKYCLLYNYEFLSSLKVK